ncbi:MAG: helix-turn-helix transcriptional regulator [Patescibacteria group bacterium]
MIRVGQKIREARKYKQVTQEDLAKAIGVSDKSISAYESERISPPLKVLEKIAAKTDQSLNYFLEDSMESTILAKLSEVEQQFREIKKILEELKKK